MIKIKSSVYFSCGACDQIASEVPRSHRYSHLCEVKRIWAFRKSAENRPGFSIGLVVCYYAKKHIMFSLNEYLVKICSCSLQTPVQDRATACKMEAALDKLFTSLFWVFWPRTNTYIMFQVSKDVWPNFFFFGLRLCARGISPSSIRVMPA